MSLRLPKIVPGLYKHYKGKIYKVINIATHTETEEKFVVYHDYLNKNSLWIRPLKMFNETITMEGNIKPRFEKITNI